MKKGSGWPFLTVRDKRGEVVVGGDTFPSVSIQGPTQGDNPADLAGKVAELKTWNSEGRGPAGVSKVSA